jgi:uncharacterized membrane protein
MDQLIPFLARHWLAGVLVVVGLLLGALLLLRWRRRGDWSLSLLLGSAGCGLLGVGGLALPAAWAWWLTVAVLAVWFGMLLVLVLSGHWWAPLGYTAGGLALLGLGGLGAARVGAGLGEAAKGLLGAAFAQPWWLLLLALIPVVVWMSFGSLAGLGPVRRWLALGLRSSLILLLTLALAEMRLRHPGETVTVLFLVDRSLSIPEEYGPDAGPTSPLARVDRRWERIKRFLNDAVEKRGSGHERDKAGLIVFGRRPRLELPPSDAPRFNFTEVASSIDNNYTDIAAALKLALASFPEGSGKRIVLLSDGNENLGNAEEQARLAQHNGVQIDVVPLAAGHRNENEILVQSVDAPSRTEQGSRLPIRVLLRSYHPHVVVGTLTLKQLSGEQSEHVPGSPLPGIRLRPGLNSIPFQQPLTDQQKSYTYEAIFQPERVERPDGGHAALVGDRPQNNSATTHVVALGRRRVLLVEQTEGEHQLLVDRLHAVGRAKYQIRTITAGRLPQNETELAAFLSNFDCVLLANLPAAKVPDQLLTEAQQEVLRSNTHDQGCGLVMIGGPESFGAGGWQGTPVEKALPVDCDIKSLEVQGKGGLVLIMHASEMADGNAWQKKIAKLAIEKLSPMDEVGVLYFDWTHRWHIPLQLIGQRRSSLLAQVDKMTPGDMPDFDPGLQMAYKALTDPAKKLATRHVIIISDGDPQLNNPGFLQTLKRDKVTVTTVGVATHGLPQDQALQRIATATAGRFHKAVNVKLLPAIYTHETRLVSQSFIYDKPFLPRLIFKGGPAENLPDPLQPLYGYVRTTPKASPLVEVPIEAPPVGEQRFPILAYWHYGLGKAVAFTSDARSQPDRPAWDRDWAGSDMYGKFWEQVLDWSLRAVETGQLAMTTEFRDGKVKVTIDARDEQNRPLTDLTLRGGVTPPSARAGDAHKLELKFEQKNSGVYEAEFKAEDAGSYFLNAQAVRKVKRIKDGKEVEVEEGHDSIRSGVTIPYSPEFADLESNPALLEKLRALTGGRAFADDDAALDEAARSGQVFRPGLPRSRSLQPVWYWLVLLAGFVLFLDVAVRRIAVDPREMSAAARHVWDRLRGRPVEAAATPEFLERLQSRKAQLAESIDRARAARRFDGEGPAVAPPGADTGPPAAPRPPARRPPQPQVAPDLEPEAADYASRLLRAKRRVWQERDQDKKDD